MSVVSRKDDFVSVPFRKRGPRVAVQFNPGPNPFDIFSQGAVAPTFGANRYRKPNCDSDVVKYAPGVVPVRFEQAGYIEPQGPVYKATKLREVVPIPTNVSMGMLGGTQEVNPAFPNYDYLAPIRPGPRALNPFIASEPTPAMFRP